MKGGSTRWGLGNPLFSSWFPTVWGLGRKVFLQRACRTPGGCRLSCRCHSPGSPRLWTAGSSVSRVQARIFIQTRIVQDFQFFKLQKVQFFKWKFRRGPSGRSTYIHSLPINQVPIPINQVYSPKNQVFSFASTLFSFYYGLSALQTGWLGPEFCCPCKWILNSWEWLLKLIDLNFAKVWKRIDNCF